MITVWRTGLEGIFKQNLLTLIMKFASVNLLRNIGFLPTFVQLKSMIFFPVYYIANFEALKRISISLLSFVDTVLCCPDPHLRMDALIKAVFHLNNYGLPWILGLKSHIWVLLQELPSAEVFCIEDESGLCTCVRAKSLQSCPTLWNPLDCNPPGSSVHGILQTRILEWVAIPFSWGSCWPRGWTCIP